MTSDLDAMTFIRVERSLTVQQAKALRFLPFFLKKLKVKHNIHNMEVSLREYGQPGCKNRYGIKVHVYDI